MPLRPITVREHQSPCEASVIYFNVLTGRRTYRRYWDAEMPYGPHTVARWNVPKPTAWEWAIVNCAKHTNYPVTLLHGRDIFLFSNRRNPEEKILGDYLTELLLTPGVDWEWPSLERIRHD